MCIDSPPSSPPRLSSSCLMPNGEPVQEYPNGQSSVQGAKFNVNFNHVYRKTHRLNPSRLGYAVKPIDGLKGQRVPSDIWRFGVELKYKEDDGTYTKLWLCQMCHQKRERADAFTYNGTAHIATHIEKVHKINPHTGNVISCGAVSLPSTPFSAVARVSNSSSILSYMLREEDRFRDAFVDWVVLHDISLDEAALPLTRGLFTWSRKNLLQVLPSSASAMSSRVKKRLEERKCRVVNLLKSSTSKISVSLDVCVSSNCLKFLVIFAHFVDADYQQRDLLIAFRNLLDDHTGQDQASIILQVIQEYGFEHKFNCLVRGGAFDGNTMLINALNDQSHILEINRQHRIHCVGHIINTVVKTTLYGSEVSKLEDELAQAVPLGRFEIYRRHGVIGKLYSLVGALCSSYKQRELFQSCLPDDSEEDPLWELAQLQPPQDGTLQWYFAYKMALRCKELRETINRFQEKYRTCIQNETILDDGTYNHILDAISGNDWDEVDRIVDFLRVPYDLAKALENSNPTSGFSSLWQTIIYLQTLWVHYDSEKEKYANSKDCYLKSAIGSGLEKLNSYWLELIMAPITSFYCVATALHPRLRLAWFQDHWRHHETWHIKAEKSVNKLYDEYLAAETGPNDIISEPRRRKVPKSYTSDPFVATIGFEEQHLTSARTHKKHKQASQLEEYFDDMFEDFQKDESYQDLMSDPWQWWLEIGRDKYPVVFKMATDILSIPSTSCECEYCFGFAKRPTKCSRDSIETFTIEALQLQKNWLRNNVVSSPLFKLADDVEQRQQKDIQTESREKTLI